MNEKDESCKELKHESPFAAICNEMTSKFDEADKVHDIDKTKALINEAKGILISHDEPA